MKAASYSRGVTLIEILVAMLVFSAGVFCMLELQLSSLKTGRSAYYQTQAFHAAESLAETLKTSGADEGFYTTWSEKLSGLIPGSTSIICIDATPEDGIPDAPACDSENSSAMRVVKIWWLDTSTESSWSRLSYVVGSE